MSKTPLMLVHLLSLLVMGLVVTSTTAQGKEVSTRTAVEACLTWGRVIEQPAGSPIWACCTDRFCVICDDGQQNCHVERRYSSGSAPSEFGVGSQSSGAPTKKIH